MQTVGVPSWEAQLASGDMVRVSVTYPNPSAPAKAVTQSIFLPAADVAELSSVLANFVSIWKPVSRAL